MKNRLFVAFAIIAAPVNAQPLAQPFVSPVFSDNMVLQRDHADPIWGWAKPGLPITVSLGERTVKTVAGADGKWNVRLTPAAAGGPYDLTISGNQTVKFKNVLVGDVWICAGQSNMEFGLNKVVNAEQEVANANYPQIRLFTLGKTPALHPLETLRGQWVPCTPETVKVGSWDGFSAVGYFFGRELYQSQKVPIGLVQVAWGSTPAEAWTSREELARIGPDFDAALQGLEQVNQAVTAGTYNRQALLNEWYQKMGISAEVSTTVFDGAAWKTMQGLPHKWSNRDEPSLGNFQGAVWFRREIDLPVGVENKTAELSLGVLDDGDCTWVNGEKVGEAMNLAPRHYKVRAGLLKPGRNIIAICVFNTFGSGGFSGKPEDLALKIAGQEPISLAGGWQYKVLLPLDQMPLRQFAISNNAGWPSELFNGMVAPLAPFGIKGVIWYQGEANVGRASQYRKLLPALIRSWRTAWQQGDSPFLVVQLPNFGPSAGAKPRESSLAELREAQAMAATVLPNVGVVTTIDIGDPNDLHPKNKVEVGQRLALVARSLAYHEAIANSGPIYKAFKGEGNAIRLTFDQVEGLTTRDGRAPTGFAIAGDDHVFEWANARIEGSEVVLSSPAVAHPVAARYDWDGSPNGNLSNQAGLPAAPFRTDVWSASTANPN